MTASYQLHVVRDGKALMRGTAWFVDAQIIATAFHVVGDERSGEWWGTIMPGLDYQLLAGDGIIALEPLAADEAADIALLKASQTPADAQVFALAEATAIERGISWHSDSFPAFHNGAFGLDGTISRIGNDTPAKALQLTVKHGTQVDWSGVSGSPVQIDRRVAGLITHMTSGTNTGWAASAVAIRALYEGLEQAKAPSKLATRDNMVKNIVQELSRSDGPPGIALLEPLRFDARNIVERVVMLLQDPKRPMLPVRLVPNPNTTDETYLYGTLYRDLRRGLQLALGQPLRKPWQDCLNTVGDTTGREVSEG